MIHVVGIAEMKVSNKRGDVLITYALGSCLAITVHDPVACVGGMLHAMLPISSNNPAKARQQPCMYVDTGIPMLFQHCYDLGAKKERLVIKAAGGASYCNDSSGGYFQVGRKNIIVLRKLLWKNGLLMKAYDVGGTCSRSLSLEVGSGNVVVKVSGVPGRL